MIAEKYDGRWQRDIRVGEWRSKDVKICKTHRATIYYKSCLRFTSKTRQHEISSYSNGKLTNGRQEQVDDFQFYCFYLEKGHKYQNVFNDKNVGSTNPTPSLSDAVSLGETLNPK